STGRADTLGEAGTNSLLPRTQEQKRNLVVEYGMGSKPFQIAEHAVDGLSLIWHSDAVFSGGGTMVREAALVGAEVYSIFAGKLGGADQALASSGRLKLISEVSDIRQLSFHKTTRLRPVMNGKRETRDFVYRQIFDFAQASSLARSRVKTGTAKWPTQ